MDLPKRIWNFKTKGEFQVLITRNRKQYEYLGTFWNLDSAYKRFDKCVEDNKKAVKFPQKTYKIRGNLYNADYEILLIRRSDTNVSLLRNEYGEYVENVAHSIYKRAVWQIYDKAPYNYEEKFWIYGKHPINDRKDFDYVINEVILNKADFAFYTRIIAYKKKLIIDRGGDNMDIVICKCKDDCDRLYEAVRKHIKGMKDKKLVKKFIFCGESNKSNVKYWTDRLSAFTGWDLSLIHI